MIDRQDPNIDDRLLERIQKLLALADPDKNDSQAQIAAALEKVSDLLAKHSITMQDVESYKAGENELTHGFAPVSELDDDGILSWGEWDHWIINLGSAIANACYCKGLFGPGLVIFVGLKRDVDIACFMMMELTQRLLALSSDEMREHAEAEKESVAALEDVMSVYELRKPEYAQRLRERNRWHTDPVQWRRNWLQGASMTLGLRISEARRRERWEIQQAAARDKKAIVTLHENNINSYMHDKMPEVSEDPIPVEALNSACNDRSAYFKGMRAGQEMQIRQGIGDTNNHGISLQKGGK